MWISNTPRPWCAQKQIEAAGLRKTIEELGPIAQVNPAVLQNFDADRIARDTASANGLPSTWLVPEEEVTRNREAQQVSQEVLAGLPAALAGLGAGTADASAAAPGSDLAADRSVASAQAVISP